MVSIGSTFIINPELLTKEEWRKYPAQCEEIVRKAVQGDQASQKFLNTSYEAYMAFIFMEREGNDVCKTVYLVCDRILSETEIDQHKTDWADQSVSKHSRIKSFDEYRKMLRNGVKIGRYVNEPERAAS